MAIRLSTLAEIKVLSLATVIHEETRNRQGILPGDVSSAIDALAGKIEGTPGELQASAVEDVDSALFKTIGIARNIRIDEDFGTQNFYGIGAPTRPRIVPNNFSANVTVERLQLDTRDLHHYITRPEYWYADRVQRRIGIDDVLLYTFLFVKSKEPTIQRHDIYALMPRTSQRAFSSGDVMVAHNVSLVGFKYSYEEAYLDLTSLINETITDSIDLNDASDSRTSQEDG